MDLNSNSYNNFQRRHIGINPIELQEMLQVIKADSLDTLIDETIPSQIRKKDSLRINEALSEHEYLKHIKEISNKNEVFRSYIGLGYHNSIIPGVILRNIFENPGWYTQYTPYQAEISQGRLEALLNFQTMVSDLTGMEIANASLLDEGTAAAEAMTMFDRLRSRKAKNANKFYVSEKCFPQTIDILQTRAEPVGIKIIVCDHNEFIFDDTVIGALLQYPAEDGNIIDYSKVIENAHENEAYIVVAADILSLAILKPPGEFGADVVVGNSQRFGVPLGFGGPHAAFFATKSEFIRSIPGRIIGVSKDAEGNNAYRMTLQTREQHIRRDKATSNICTAQALLAIIAGMYAVYHGPKGLKLISQVVHNLATILESELKKLGFEVINEHYFDTLRIKTDNAQELVELAVEKQINFRNVNHNTLDISINEVTTLKDISEIVSIFAKSIGKVLLNPLKASDYENLTTSRLPENLKRTSEFLTHPVFNSHHSETQMLRYIKSLENKDLSLTSSMISLGSCTMKLNATSEMIPLSWSEFSAIHPFAPLNQAKGYYEVIKNLENDLAEITGFDGVSLQPNSGAQGEYAGLMVIRAHQKDIGQSSRNIVLIPSSAHGTNPASAVMAGMKVVVVKCDDNGNIDIEDLRVKAIQYKDSLSALMVTYPSTHGVFEEGIKEICSIVHENGGQVYMDGANMNAQVGLTSPAIIGADVCHLNLHKTFAIP
ncbi:MAG: glycine dehydrogenase (aminomethyl-transferring), partial [Calditrichaeota bacterium]